ncbi:FAD-dependent monooxygenase [Mycobacteroides abscessus]|uniref:FAD-dependent monooxygenase n=1 Tax=Mycobacteroides abscessus TaxID=36809 RepID=UPI00038699FE|nr:FAD-dependent monooxygenase [Mycobacteroides abscessus]EPZ18413.1 hypothetical protein M879_21605 [Mycobacteroides abscessus V06705]MBN7550300.1 FAD-dependent monooxygenase [Mycobacteroides abscessus subsp. abscessus]MDM2692238.1 FAD-dependent monooxygenase [Mycobacteroides abscessus]MDM2697050.1 FAD-dependent monooxygenase [Mycobacteroides abscessus]MDM2702225.1 FAD-dependent monooxygenase [Mycobacteroides abscessus]
MGQRVLVAGASIAGPVTAFWLDRGGYEVTVIERSSELRRSGQNVDIRGEAREIIRRMDLESILLANSTTEQGTRFVDRHGHSIAEFPSGISSHDGLTAGLEILRGEFAAILVDAAGHNTQYRFGDYVTEITQDGGGVDVALAGGTTERYDYVIFADGMRSSSRDLVFPHEAKVRELGLYFAYGVLPRTVDDDLWWRWYQAGGGRVVTLRPDNLGTTRFMMSWLSKDEGYDTADFPARIDALQSVFAGAGWETPRILGSLTADSDVYIDYIAQIRAPRWTNGRVALVGDAAWCATPLTGMGTSLAIVGAYVLASELAGTPDPAAAFAAYERRLRPYIQKVQTLPPGVPRIGYPKSKAAAAALSGVLQLAGSRPMRPIANRILSPTAAKFDLPEHSWC